MKTKFYETCDRETGTTIDQFKTEKEALAAIRSYEEQDKKDGVFEEDFYDVCVVSLESTIRTKSEGELWARSLSKKAFEFYSGDESISFIANDRFDNIAGFVTYERIEVVTIEDANEILEQYADEVPEE